MNDSTYQGKIGLMMTDGFKVGNGLKQRDGLASNLFNIRSIGVCNMTVISRSQMHNIL
jgi:hypothetical protein